MIPELDLNAAGSEIEEESDVDRVPSADESDNEIDSVANDDKTMDADERDEIGNEGREGVGHMLFNLFRIWQVRLTVCRSFDVCSKNLDQFS